MSKRLPQTKTLSYFVKQNRTDLETQPISSNDKFQTPEEGSLQIEGSSVSTLDSELNKNEAEMEALSFGDFSTESQKMWMLHQEIGTVDEQFDPNFQNESSSTLTGNT